ncbi:hypothetical protein M0R45_035373 [Rubus argutus]|uniref:Uncharacterized protein n=1 Tax=Rubus argutus TaxID=59490 RepID=A0AAW1VUM0_RUBAR
MDRMIFKRRRGLTLGSEEGEGTAAVVEAGQVRRRETEEEEMEQRQAKGEGSTALWPGGAIRDLMARGSIRMVSAHSSQQIYTRATNT